MEYKIKREKRKTLSMQILADGSLLIKAPFHCPDEWIDDFISRHEKWIRKHREFACQVPTLSAEEKKHLKAEAQKYLPRRTSELASQIGLFPENVKVTCANTRFGSCSNKKTICLSARLMLLPPALIDAVIFHELCHCRWMNHQKPFYDLLYSVCPKYPALRAELKKISPTLPRL